MSSGLKLFSGRSNLPLAKKIAEALNIELGSIAFRDFQDGEIWVKFEENIRGKDVFIIQTTSAPAQNIMELLIMLDAAKRASAQRITAVIPYFGYARQDRKDQPRVSITAKLVANLYVTAGASRILTMDLHAPQIQGFFDIPLDHLYSAPIFVDYYKQLNIPDLVVVSPDIGGITMTRAFARRLNAPLAMVDKRRPMPNQVKVMQIIGEVANRNVLMIDDIVDTGGTLVKAAEGLKKAGARDIYVACTHALLSGNALANIENSPINEITVTDTVVIPEEKKSPKIKVLSSANLLARAIENIYQNESISRLFDVIKYEIHNE